MFRPFDWRIDTPDFRIIVEAITYYDFLDDYPVAQEFTDVDDARQQLSIGAYIAVDLHVRCFVKSPQTGALHYLFTHDGYGVHIQEPVLAALDNVYGDRAMRHFVLDPLTEYMQQTYPQFSEAFTKQITAVFIEE
jgi:hypothetical protein